MTLALTLLLVAAAALSTAVAVRHSGNTRRKAVTRLLDAADALETRLRSARAELEAVTGDPHPMREAMQEMLRQRLWLQQHGQSASLKQIDAVRQILEHSRSRIDQQLARIHDARSSLV